MISKINEQDFEKLVLGETSKMVLVDFYAPWCGPCKTMAPMLAKVADKMHEKVRFFKIDVEENPNIASKYKVRSIPTLMLFSAGERVKLQVGSMSEEELEAWLETPSE
jgi:thioredoxin 1